MAYEMGISDMRYWEEKNLILIAFYNKDPKITFYNSTNFEEISSFSLPDMNLIKLNFIEKTDLIVIYN